ncbi:MAG TPA: S-adenosylmethionine tRNA ribosyltransferase [Cytophagales bacterium]|nr:S-adenosylmethionine tRNA ribosyltransferase [Cytophagales bacterium]HAP64085.1 S-adenosylmethionine tRNA ribosyltransferase [Cytophagales bacterium]
MELPVLSLSDYTYPLPEDRIAKHPLTDRASSRLLHYHAGQIRHHGFRELPQLLPPRSHLVFNDTKVIPARLHFTRETGARIEIFLLHPVAPTRELALAMSATQSVTWQCIIGNLKRWKDDVLKLGFEVEGSPFVLKARLVDRDERWVELSWDPGDIPFVTWLEAAGHLPIPPYLQRDAQAEDEERYQTVYSSQAGAVAAPTAGLHFTDDVLGQLEQQEHTQDFLTLHVSAGTFQPIKTENAVDHTMHQEQVVIYRHNLEKLLDPAGPVIAVGTTSLRTLESTYWYGVQLLQDAEATFFVPKLIAYQEYVKLPSRREAMEAILQRMDALGTDMLVGETEIYCFPGYTFRVVEGLVTNYHQPESTLILLVAAFIGEDWRKVYQAALDQDYRFLSYGDSSLLLPHHPSL